MVGGAGEDGRAHFLCYISNKLRKITDAHRTCFYNDIIGEMGDSEFHGDQSEDFGLPSANKSTTELIAWP